ncbi:MAG TPA: cyclase family protein [Chitinophagales bacterium]|nr:cyclase family protein [Chitinophagales bacterium]
MHALINFGFRQYKVSFSEPLDISIPLQAGDDSVNAFYAPPFEISPVQAGDFIGSVKAGGCLNFFNVKFNPHGNGTHTECVGHIAEGYTIHKCLKKFFFLAELVSIFPARLENGDEVILREDIEKKLRGARPEALIIRTLPNDLLKLKKNYSGKNPPYLQADAATLLVEKNIRHLLVDLPSVDREVDGGKLAAHKIFWQYPRGIRKDATITELVFVPTEIADGTYLLNLQIASFELDASPSKPVLYKLTEA